MSSEELDEERTSEDEPCQWTLEEELKTNERLRLEDIEALRTFCLCQPKGDENLITDNLLAALLNSADYDLEKAEVIAKKHINTRAEIPEIFTNRDIDSDELMAARETTYMLPMKVKTPDGYRVLLTSMRRSDPALFNHAAVSKYQFLTIDACLHEDPTVPGFVFVNDVGCMSMRHMLKCNIFLVKKLMKYQQEGIPLKIHQAHFLNTSSFTHKMMSFVKPLMNKELFEMIRMYTSDEMELLYEQVPRECLPEDFGGTLPDLETLHEEHIKWLRDLQPQLEHW